MIRNINMLKALPGNNKINGQSKELNLSCFLNYYKSDKVTTSSSKALKAFEPRIVLFLLNLPCVKVTILGLAWMK